MLRSLVVAGFFVVVIAGAAAASQTAAAQPAGPAVTLTLSNGSRLIGEITKEENGKIYFKDQVLGDVVVDQSSVVARDGAQAPAPAPQAPAAPSVGSAVPAFALGNKAIWSRTITAGGSFTSAAFIQGQIPDTFAGITGEALKLSGSQTTAQAGLSLVRATATGVAFWDGSYTYANYEPFGKQADQWVSTVGYNHKLSDKSYTVARVSFKRDKIRQIDSSIIGMFGVGRTLIATPKVKFDVVPGITLLREEKGTQFDGDVLFGGGALENLTITPNPFFSFEQRELYYIIFNHTELYGLESYAGIRGMLNKYLGITFGLSYVYDNTLAQRFTVVPANALFAGSPQLSLLANEKGQALLTAGFQIRF
jgi:hypothetical protein